MPVIGNLQVLRGVAALSVVFLHTWYLLPAGFHTDFRAVQTFFVISGFIMCLIAQTDPSRFLSRRLLRIVPLYWLCTAVLEATIHHWGFARPWTWSAEFWRDFLSSLLFVPAYSPMKEYPLLFVGWTLNIEMYFYVLFAVALRLDRRLAPLIAAGGVLVGMALPSAGCTLTACQVYAYPHVRYFIVGIALFYAWRFVGDRLPKLPTLALCTLAIVFCYAVQLQPPGRWTDIIPIVLVAATLALTAVGVDAQRKPLLLFGDASYATYLTHPIVLTYVPGLVTAGIIASPRDTLWSMLLVLAGCQAIGIATHLCIERPLGRVLRDRLASRAGSQQSPARARRSGEPDDRIAAPHHA